MSLVTSVRPNLLLLLAFLTTAVCSHASIFQSGGPLAGAPVTLAEQAQGYRDGRVLVKLREVPEDPATRAQWREEQEALAGIRQRQGFSQLPGLGVLEFDSNRPVKEVIRELQATGLYEYVEPDRIIYPFAPVIPNDPSFGNLWGLNNTGQSGGTGDADIDAPEAWEIRTNASDVIVAVIDSGINLTHEDLAQNLWINSNVSSGSPNRHGLNARTSGTAPQDDGGHGSHVAATIGAVGNNGRGVAGVAWNVKLMALKFLPADGGGSTVDAIECIDFAITHKAQIINASYGSSTFSSSEWEAMKRAGEAGIIFVAAAGNDGTDNDRGRDYPAGYLLPNVVAVAATNRNDMLAGFSNFGSGSVELAAPGESVYSATHESNSSYGYKNGTSMAAPHVSGALALLKAQFPQDTSRQLINRLLRSVDQRTSFAGKTQTGGRLNLHRALTSTDNRPFNDDFAQRARLSGPNVRVRSENSGATVEPGEPAHGGISGTTSLWWEWTAATTGPVVLDTAGSDYDTLLAVYEGATLGQLVAKASNDNATGVTSRIEMNVTTGTTYQIAVSGKGSATGFTVMRIGSVPTNDRFTAATVVEGESFLIEGSTRNASQSAGEPSVAGFNVSRTVWYRWVAPVSATYQLSAFSTEVDTVAAVYSGNSLNNLAEIGSNNDSSSDNTDALVTFPASAGTAYYFAVADRGSPNAEGGPFTLTLNRSIWQFPATDEITGSPAVGADGTIYIGSLDGYLYAVTAGGSRRWRYTVGSEVDIDTAAPAIAADGTIYVGATDGGFHAVNPNGTRRWRFASSTSVMGTPALAEDGTIYFRNQTQLVALTPEGTQKWSLSLSGATYSSPVVAADGTIYAGATGGKFYAVNPNGTPKWTYTANSDIYSSPAIAEDGTIYFATLTSSRLYALRPDGTLKWSTTVGSGRDISSSPVLGPDGTIYLGAYDGRLWAISSTGTAKWSYLMGDEVRASSPAVDANGVIYIGSYDNHVHAVSSAGQRIRTYPTARRIRSTMTLANDRLYFGSQDAKLYAFAAAPAANSPWPQFQHDAAKTGRASTVSTPRDDPPPPSSGANDDPRLANLSTLAHVGSGESLLIGGVYVGDGSRRVLVRAIGPDLATRGIGNALSRPRLSVFSGSTEIASNEGWNNDSSIAAAAQASGASTLPAGSADAALLLDLSTGAYTAQVTSINGTAGQALVEFFEVGPDGSGRLKNLSTRASISSTRHATAGFYVASGSRRVLIRVAGPALGGAPYNIATPAGDPKFTVYNSAGNVIAENDNWGDSSVTTATMQSAGAVPFQAGSKDAAIMLELAPGAYTAVAQNATSAEGVALLEIYVLD